MIAFYDDCELDTTTCITYRVDTGRTDYTAVTRGRLARDGHLFIDRICTIEPHLQAVEVPQKNWRPWHALATFVEPPLPRCIVPASRALLRRQERWPRAEAARRKRRRFLQEIRA